MLLRLDPHGNFNKAWRFGGEGEDGATRPAGIVGNTVYVVGWINSGTVDFPTGYTLVNVNSDMCVMALDGATPAPSLLAAAAPLTSDDSSLMVSSYKESGVGSPTYSRPQGNPIPATTGVRLAAKTVRSDLFEAAVHPAHLTNAEQLVDPLFSRLDLFGRCLNGV